MEMCDKMYWHGIHEEENGRFIDLKIYFMAFYNYKSLQRMHPKKLYM